MIYLYLKISLCWTVVHWLSIKSLQMCLFSNIGLTAQWATIENLFRSHAETNSLKIKLKYHVLETKYHLV